MTERKGPIESRPWSPVLEALVVDAKATRIHGYDVEGDLARHYRFSDLVYLSLAGELPDDRQSRGFEIALCFLMPMSVADAPMHVSVLAGFFGSSAAGILSSAAVTLADDARSVTDLFAAIDANGDLPESHRAADEEETASVARLRALLDGVLDVPLLAKKPRRDLALVAALRACGLSTPLQIATVMTLARLPIAVAEAEPRAGQDFVEKYPLDTPPFQYEEEGSSS